MEPLCSGQPCYPPGYALELLTISGVIGILLGLICIGVGWLMVRR